MYLNGILCLSIQRNGSGGDDDFYKHVERYGVKFHEENVIVLTALYVPVYVIFVASLGPKFSFCKPCLEAAVFDFEMVFERLESLVDDFVGMSTVTKEREKFKSKLSERSFRVRTSAPSAAQEFIQLQLNLTKTFLSKNPDVVIMSADKGGRIVITDKTIYKSKMDEFVSSNVRGGIYSCLPGIKIQYVKSVCEAKWKRILGIVNVFLENDRLLQFPSLITRISFESFVVSRIYGLIKVHKGDFPVRPIISSTDSMGKPLEKWILAKLNIIAKHIGKHQVKNAHQLFERLNGKILQMKDHVLVTWDFDSMFTNIPFQKTKEIVRRYYHLIQRETTMPVEVFLECLNMLVEEFGFFTYEGRLYLQTEGLSMGNSLSQILAEITTSYFLNGALTDFKDEEISFIFKFVDDIVGGVKRTCLDAVQKSIEKRSGMKLKVCLENYENEVEYLQMKLKRNADKNNLIDVFWSQKEYASKVILNFHSFHPWQTKESVASEYIMTALTLSSKSYWKKVTTALRKTLRRSGYPRKFVDGKISEALRDRNDGRTGIRNGDRNDVTYVRCPFQPGAIGFIRRSVKRSGVKNVLLAPAMISCNRNEIFSNLKDVRSLSCVKNASFVVRCLDCDFKKTVFAERRDIESVLKAMIEDGNSELSKHRDGMNHRIDSNINRTSVKRFRGEFELNCAKRLCR